MSEPKIIIVGGGLAGLSAAMKIAESGIKVDLFSMVPVKRSHSVCAQGGINGAVNTKGEGDSPEIHFYDTIKGGDFLADQPLPRGMCYSAPAVIYMMDRMGVQFNRTNEGLLDFRRFGGTLYSRTAFAGATTGQQLLYALDEQVRRYEADKLVKKYEFFEFLGIVKDSAGVCRGIMAIDMRTMEIKTFAGDAVILGTGGPGMVYGRSTNSMSNTGSAASAVYQQGVWYANGEFIQIHPTAIPGQDKHRLMSESARGEGGRVWVPKQKGDKRPPEQIPDSERWYFLEEKYPLFGNLVPRDVASRDIHEICIEQGYGIDGKAIVYLDLTHIPAEQLDRKLGGILEIYEKFVGQDPRKVPMKIFPAVHYSMGGIWIDFESNSEGMPAEGSPKNHQTNVPGLYAIGECDFQYHGANRLGANALLSCIYSGLLAGPGAVAYAKNNAKITKDIPTKIFDDEKNRWEEKFKNIGSMNGEVNPYKLWLELGDIMYENVLILRYNQKLKETYEKINALQDKWKKCSVLDNSKSTNQTLLFMNQLWNMFELAKIITKCAILRDECRGSHWKPEFLIPQPADIKPKDYYIYLDSLDGKEDAKAKMKNMKPDHIEYYKKFKENNDKWLKTTIAEFKNGEPEVSYRAVNTSSVRPHPRKYD